LKNQKSHSGHREGAEFWEAMTTYDIAHEIRILLENKLIKSRLG
jgi:hypothetical protein